MEKNLARSAALALLALCLLGGCATDPQTANANGPYPVEQAAPVAHGETSVLYGRSAGH
jgi:uncharacterized lipoprotein YajG